jgi:hypothetical protein
VPSDDAVGSETLEHEQDDCDRIDEEHLSARRAGSRRVQPGCRRDDEKRHRDHRAVRIHPEPHQCDGDSPGTDAQGGARLRRAALAEHHRECPLVDAPVEVGVDPVDRDFHRREDDDEDARGGQDCRRDDTLLCSVTPDDRERDADGEVHGDSDGVAVQIRCVENGEQPQGDHSDGSGGSSDAPEECRERETAPARCDHGDADSPNGELRGLLSPDVCVDVLVNEVCDVERSADRQRVSSPGEQRERRRRWSPPGRKTRRCRA